MGEDKLLVCRCEEVYEEEIRQAIREGADTLTGVKRRTRAGMGMCQGKTCQRLVTGILRDELGKKPGDILPDTSRPPVRPIPFGVLGGLDDE